MRGRAHPRPSPRQVLRGAWHADRLPDPDRDRGALARRAQDDDGAAGMKHALIAGGGKVGAHVARSLLRMGHEVTIIEQSPYRHGRLEDEFGRSLLLGDATELHVLERAG